MYGDPVTSHTRALFRPFNQTKQNLLKLKMAEYDEILKTEYESLRKDSTDLITKSLDARDVIRRVLRTRSDIVSLAPAHLQKYAKATHEQELSTRPKTTGLTYVKYFREKTC